MNYKEYLFSIFFNPDTYASNPSHFTEALNTASSVKDQFYFKALYVQAYHETGNFTSNVFHTCNNFYGMTAPNSRHLYDEIKVFGSEKFASYKNFYLSHQDRFMWDNQSRYFSVPTSAIEVYNYYNYLVDVRHYATDPEYYNKLVNLFAQKSANSDFFNYDNQEMRLSLNSSGFKTDFISNTNTTQNTDIPEIDVQEPTKKAKGIFYFVPFFVLISLVFYFIRKRKK